MLTKEDKILIKKMPGNQKKYGVRWLIKEFLNKKWSKDGVEVIANNELHWTSTQYGQQWTSAHDAYCV